MNENFVDIHTHPFKSYFKNQDEEFISCYENGIEILFFTATEKKEFTEVKKITEKYKFVKGVYGIHPTYSEGANDGTFLLENIPKNAIAIGEIGLDFYRKENPDKKIQISSFVSQINLAKKLNLPVIIHCRNSFEELWKIVSNKKYLGIKFVFHTFSENWSNAKKILRRSNFWFSFSGVITFKNSEKTHEVIRNLPIEKIFAETDTPYLTPVPFRGKRNSSKNVFFVYKKIAELKNMELNFVIKKIRENVNKVFGI